MTLYERHSKESQIKDSRNRRNYFHFAFRLFQKQIRNYMNPNLKDEERFVPITINVNSPFEGIQDVINTLRTIQNSEKELTLYLDTHGGLRGVQRILEATVSLLKVENINVEEAFSIEFSNSQNSSVLKPKI